MTCSGAFTPTDAKTTKCAWSRMKVGVGAGATRGVKAAEVVWPVISELAAMAEPDLSAADMGCNYRGELSRPLRHVPAALSVPADVCALGTAKRCHRHLCVLKKKTPMNIGLSFPACTG